ncbi:hypothetical protein FDECE_1886 [Fusarium decemcellulare]|nr:hypothetical protein FDECE_1886 [Fusarium decemcellulare]
MNLSNKTFAFQVLAFQSCIFAVYAQYGDGGVIGYSVSDGTGIPPLSPLTSPGQNTDLGLLVRTVVCARSDYTFDTSTTYYDDARTFAYCGPTTDGVETVGTSCYGDDLVYTGWDPEDDNPTGTMSWILFLEEPTEDTHIVSERPSEPSEAAGPTPTETSTTDTDDEPTDVKEDITTTITLPPTSVPTKKPDGGLSGGKIAGVVIGAIAGICLIAGAIILAFRYGRRTTDHEGGGPRPTSFVSTWTNPTQGPSAGAVHNNVPVLQMSTADAGVTTKPEGGSWVASPISSVSKSPVHNSPPPINVQTRPVAQPPFVGAELPTSLESQGWARSENHPVPYEADSSVAYMPYRPPPT